MSPVEGFALAAALHAGFQLTVTWLVYPVLVRVPSHAWTEEHDRHSRRIVPLVGLTYGGLLVTGAWVLLDGVGGPLAAAALLAAAACLGVTALAAAPTHGRLTRPDPPLLRRLLLADRLRAGLAVGAAGLAAAAVGFPG